MLDQISGDKAFDEEDEEKLETLITDMTAWMNKYAGLYDDPDTILEDLEMPTEVVEPVEEPQDQSVEIYIEYQYPGMQLDTSSFSVSFTFYD